MKIRKAIKKFNEDREISLYHTLVGSIITSIGIIKGNNEYQNYKVFKELRKAYNEDREITVKLLVEEAANLMKVDIDKLKNLLVLVYDDNGILGPMVTLQVEDKILPLKPNAEYTGILFTLMRNTAYAKAYIKVEKVYI